MLKNVKYMFTTHDISLMPQDDIPEVVIVGKSNVGKSTLVNAITNNSKLAHIANRPGKTQAISLFDVDGKMRIADVPGYGYAKVPMKQVEAFAKLIDSYLNNRPNLVKAILLLDMRRGITEDDWQMINYFITLGLPFVVIGTKMDKVNQSAKHKFNKQIKDELSTTVINSSFLHKKGIDQVEALFAEFL